MRCRGASPSGADAVRGLSHASVSLVGIDGPAAIGRHWRCEGHDEPEKQAGGRVMTPFELLAPASLAEAVALLDPDDREVRPFAGGTALMLMMRSGLYRPRRLISLRGVEPDARAIAASEDGGLRIGAMATLAALERSDVVREAAPVIVETLRRLANIRVRNAATVGGHLGHGDPHQDLPPVLIALGAEVSVIGPSGGRTVPVEALYQGYLETTLAADELIAGVTVPPQGHRRAAYLKMTTRSADDWPALGVAVSFALDGRRIRAPLLVVGAATDTPKRLARAEAALEDAEIGEAALRDAGAAAAAEADIVADARGSAAYKRELLKVCVGRAVRRAAGEAGP